MNELRDQLWESLGYVPNPEQRAVHDSGARFKVAAGGEQSGKALASDTLVPTVSGWKTQGSLEVGDTVFDELGRPVQVIAVHSVQHDRPCYRVLFDDGIEVIADAAHEWLTENIKERKNNLRRRDGVWTEKIRETGEMALDAIDIASRGAMSNYSVKLARPIEYPEKDLLIPPYLLGVWLGDGTGVSGAITTADHEVVERIEAFGYQVTKRKQVYAYGVLGLQIQLRDIGVLGNKHIPESYEMASVEQRIELLRGLMDTDGYADKGGSVTFYNTNKRLIDGVLKLLRSLGIKARIGEKRATLYGKDCGACYSINFTASFSVFNLERKRERQKMRLRGGAANRHYIVSIEPVSSVPVRCISVSGESHLYLVTESFIPTHNSFLAAKELGAWVFDWLLKYGKSSDGKKITEFTRKDGLWWLIGPTYEECKPEAEYFTEDMAALGLVKKGGARIPMEGACRITLPFGVVESLSAEDERKIARRAPDGIILCEAARLSYMAWLKARARVAPKRGPILAVGTFEPQERGTGGSEGWYAELWRRWQGVNDEMGASFSIPTWSNRHFYPGGREDPEILRLEATLGHDLFMERCGAVPTKSHTLVFPEFSTITHVTDITLGEKFEWLHDETGHLSGIVLPRNIEFTLAIDPGYAGAYAVLLIAELDGRAFVHDMIYEHKKTGREIIAMLKGTPSDPGRWTHWWNRIKSGVIDIAGKQHPAGESQVELWAEAGIPLSYEYINEYDNIERHRSYLALRDGVPNLFINSRCKAMIEEYHRWQYRRVEGMGIDGRLRTINEAPVDSQNHCMKAFGYWAVVRHGHIARKKREEYAFVSPFTDWSRIPKQEEQYLPWPLRT